MKKDLANVMRVKSESGSPVFQARFLAIFQTLANACFYAFIARTLSDTIILTEIKICIVG